ncbi:MAG TPA: hypothetical protein V6C97_05760, partial [Oculatellaceae cyanobacterium]
MCVTIDPDQHVIEQVLTIGCITLVQWFTRNEMPAFESMNSQSSKKYHKAVTRVATERLRYIVNLDATQCARKTKTEKAKAEAEAAAEAK